LPLKPTAIVFDTPTQIASGSTPIEQAKIDMKDYPVLSKFGVPLSTDFYL